MRKRPKIPENSDRDLCIMMSGRFAAAAEIKPDEKLKAQNPLAYSVGYRSGLVVAKRREKTLQKESQQ